MTVRVRFGGYFKTVYIPHPKGIMPLARKLGEYVEQKRRSDDTTMPKLKPIALKPVKLNPELWGDLEKDNVQ